LLTRDRLRRGQTRGKSRPRAKKKKGTAEAAEEHGGWIFCSGGGRLHGKRANREMGRFGEPRDRAAFEIKKKGDGGKGGEGTP